MRSHDYYLLDVFTDRAFSGNPLAVFPHVEGMEADTMQAIANELNLSETVFVGRASAPERYPIRIFTPAMELPFAGHPTIGTALLLAELGMAERDRPLTLEAGVGPLAVSFENDLARFTTAAPLDVSASTLTRLNAARMLGLEPDEIAGEPVLASCGLPYHLVELVSLEALGHAQPSPREWAEWISPSGYDQVYLYVVDRAYRLGNVIQARMFAGKGGMWEDPATGSAAAALVGQLALHGNLGTRHWQIHQGIEMKRPSLIHAETDYDGTDLAIHIVGKAVIVGSGVLRGSLACPSPRKVPRSFDSF